MHTFISIDNLKVNACHGVSEQETVVGNLFEVSVILEYDFSEAAENDDLTLTINYAELTDLVVDTMKTPRRLIESVAMEMKRRIMERWPATVSGQIEITKLHPPIPAPTPRATVVVAW